MYKIQKILCKDLRPIIKCYITILDFTQNDKSRVSNKDFLLDWDESLETNFGLIQQYFQQKKVHSNIYSALFYFDKVRS